MPLFVVFLVRNNCIRVISAWDMTVKELEVYRDCLKKNPKFKTEDDERDFWSTHDASDYLDFSQAEETVFPNLTPEVPRRDRNPKDDQNEHWGD